MSGPINEDAREDVGREHRSGRVDVLEGELAAAAAFRSIEGTCCRGRKTTPWCGKCLSEVFATDSRNEVGADVDAPFVSIIIPS